MLRNIHKTQIRDVQSGINRNYMSRENFTVGDDTNPQNFPTPTGDDWSQEDIDTLKVFLKLDEKDFNNADLIINCAADVIIAKYPKYTEFYNLINNKDENVLLIISVSMVTCIVKNVKNILTETSDWNDDNEKQLKYIAKYIIFLLNTQGFPIDCNYLSPIPNQKICDKTLDCILQNIKKTYPNYANFYNSFTNDFQTNFNLLTAANSFDDCKKLPTPQPPTPQPPTPQPPTPQPPTPQPKPSSDTDNKNNTLLIIGIVVGSLFLLALIIFFILHRH